MGDENKFPWPTIILTLLAAAAIGVAVWLWLHPKTVTVTQPGHTVYQTITSPPAVLHDVKTVTVPGPERIVTIEKPVFIDRIPDLPPQLVNNPQELPVAAAELPLELEGQDVGTVQTAVFVNRSTGQTTVTQKQTPPDLFGLENHGEFGLWYGYNQHAKEVLQGDLSWYFLRLGPAHFGIRAEADNGPTLKALGGLKVGW